MSKILKNTTGSAINVSDTGITIPASPGQYTIPANDYLLWAASDDVITEIGSGDLVVNDGSSDLGISDGTDLIKGLHPRGLIGATDNTPIGNTGDSLHVKVDGGFDSPVFISPARETSDIFSRLRVSNPSTLYEHEFKYDQDVDIYWSIKSEGGATQEHEADTVSHKMIVGTADGDKATFQSRRNIEYNKGKSQLFYLTGLFGALKAGVRKRLGLFDDNNGIFFETDGTSLYVVKRSKTTGSVVDDRVVSSNWNLDTLDGSGDENNPSGAAADPTKQQLFVLEYSWLGSGSVRYGIFINGVIVYIHQTNYSNNMGGPYSQSGQLPFRAELENTTAQGASDELKLTCVTAISEGGQPNLGKVKSSDTGTSSINLTTTETSLFAIRINPGYPYSSLQLKQFKILASSGNSEIYYRLIHNPVIVGATWTDNPSSITQNLTALTSYSGGHIVDSDYATVGKAETSAALKSDIFLGRDIDDNPDVYLIEARTISSTAKVFLSIKWREFI